MPKSDDVSWREFVTHPLATIGAAVSLVGGVSFGMIEPFVGTLWSQAGALFAVFSVSSGALADELEWLPKDLLGTLALAAGGLFVANRVYRVYHRYRKESNE